MQVCKVMTSTAFIVFIDPNGFTITVIVFDIENQPRSIQPQRWPGVKLILLAVMISEMMYVANHSLFMSYKEIEMTTVGFI